MPEAITWDGIDLTQWIQLRESGGMSQRNRGAACCKIRLGGTRLEGGRANDTVASDRRERMHTGREREWRLRLWARQDSNLQPRDYESPALTIELRARLALRRTLSIPFEPGNLRSGMKRDTADATEPQSKTTPTGAPPQPTPPTVRSGGGDGHTGGARCPRSRPPPKSRH